MSHINQVSRRLGHVVAKHGAYGYIHVCIFTCVDSYVRILTISVLKVKGDGQ
jgi:hypothetical protein